MARKIYLEDVNKRIARIGQDAKYVFTGMLQHGATDKQLENFAADILYLAVGALNDAKKEFTKSNKAKK